MIQACLFEIRSAKPVTFVCVEVCH